MLPTTIEQFLTSDVGEFSQAMASVTPGRWEEVGRVQALRVFHEAATHVPAYADFLRRNGVDALRITNLGDFRRLVPPTDKASYIDQYPLSDLVWNGQLSTATLINSSSGTDGRRYYWPTSQEETSEASLWHEYLFNNLFRISDRSTLLVVCFGMGSWIAGSYTTNSTRFFDRKGYTFTTVTPGFDRDQAARVIDAVCDQYDQVVIAGIPSFVRDFVTEVALPHGRTRILLAGESFTEAWRDFVLSRVGSTQTCDVASLYGSADGGMMGFETAASIRVRRTIQVNSRFRHALLGGERVPMLFQFAPGSRYFEMREGERVPMLFQFAPGSRYFEMQEDELLLTTNRTLPLVRYNLHDEGKVISADHLNSLLAEFQSDTPVGAESENGVVSQMPFVAVYGRGRFGTTLYGANICVDDVQDLFQVGRLAASFTGRFLMQTSFDTDQTQRLELHAELSRSVVGTTELATQLADAFVEMLTNVSSEYRAIHAEYGKRARPHVTLHLLGSNTKFSEAQQVKLS